MDFFPNNLEYFSGESWKKECWIGSEIGVSVDRNFVFGGLDQEMVFAFLF